MENRKRKRLTRREAGKRRSNRVGSPGPSPTPPPQSAAAQALALDPSNVPIHFPLRRGPDSLAEGSPAPAAQSPSLADPARAQHRFVVFALAYIHANPARPITTREVAESAGASLQYFCKVFAQAVGMPFLRYLAWTRVENAARLLRDSSVSAKEAAFASGWGSIAQFNRDFKRWFGVSPTEFRDRQRRPGV